MKKDLANEQYYAAGYEDPVKFIRIERVFNFLNNNIKNAKDKKILDIGCYGSHLLYTLHSHGYKNLYGLDIVNIKNEYNFKYDFTKGDIENGTKFTNNYFDIVVMSHVLEHLYNVPAAINEIQRILKKGGYFVLCLPLDLNLFARILHLFGSGIHNPFSTGTHIKFYKYNQVIDYFKRNKFQLEKTDYSFIRYGLYDKKYPFLKKIASLSPDNLSSEVIFLFKNIKGIE